jgi:ketoreductase
MHAPMMVDADKRAELSGKRALVTGGGTGIGQAIARCLAAAGASVAVTGRRRAPLDETVQLIARAGGRCIAEVMDVSDAVAVKAVVPRVAELLGGLDILVNNAGAGGPNACALDGPDRWDEIVRTNLDGVFLVTREALRRLADGGRVINISSVLGRFGVPGYTAYCASKHGVIGFTKALALEVAARKITVNAICPGWVETEMAHDGMELLGEALGVGYDEARRHALSQVPIGRIIEPDEVGTLVCYIAGPRAGAMTAQAISLCGGTTMV